MITLLRGAVTALVLIAAAIPPAHGQWSLSLDAQRSAYGGTSEDTSSDARSSARPSRTLALTLRASRQWDAFTAAVGARVARASLIAEAPGVAVQLGGEFKFVELLPELSWRLLRTGRGATLEVYGGPVLGLWWFEDFGERFVPGATAGFQGLLPIFDRLSMSVRVGGGLMRSVFRASELPPESVSHPMRRSEVSLGLRYDF